MYTTTARPTLIQFNSGQIITTCSRKIHINIILPSMFTRTSPKLTPFFRFSTKILCSLLHLPCSQFVLNKVNYMTDQTINLFYDKWSFLRPDTHALTQFHKRLVLCVTRISIAVNKIRFSSINIADVQPFYMRQ